MTIALKKSALNKVNQQAVIESVKLWVNKVVVQFNLCPFAQRELVDNRVRFVVSEADTEKQLLADLRNELNELNTEQSIATSLLIHPNVLNNFSNYNQFLDLADALIMEAGYEGVFQVASFHPHYQFNDTLPEDAENYTNRSPYPILHLLREESVSRAIEHYPDAHLIPQRNIRRLQEIGTATLSALLQECKTPS